MKKHWTVLLRLLVAVAGVTYIAANLTWTDRLAVPTDFWHVGSPAAELEVVGQDKDLLTVRLLNGAIAPVQRTRIGQDSDQAGWQPSILTTLGGANGLLLLAGLLLMGLMWPLQTMRWLVLMRCRGLSVSAIKAFRLTMVGLFFNFCMPGLTGGDLVKAYYAAKGSGARGTAVMSVVFDRITGLVALALLAGGVGCLMLDQPVVRGITLAIGAGIAVGVVAGALYFSRQLRRILGIDRLRDRVSDRNLLVRIDGAALAYRDHKAAVMIAVGVGLAVHVTNSLATMLAGYALGMDVALMLMLVILPVIFLAGAIPISYQGLGVMEAVAMALLLGQTAATANQIIGMLLIIRLYLVFYALVGSLLMLRGDIRLHSDNTESEPGMVGP